MVVAMTCIIILFHGLIPVISSFSPVKNITKHEGIKNTALDVMKNCSDMLKVIIKMIKKVTPPKLGTW